MYNIALAMAIAISSYLTLGSKILTLAVPAEALRTLPAYLQLGLNFTVNYWIPSIIIYLILRAIRAERFLNASVGIHVILAIANIQRLLYGGLLMFASTIRGGGASFVLMTLGGKINPFFKVLLLIGLLWLFIRSVASDNNHDNKEREYKPILKSASGIVASIGLITALAFLGTVYAQNRETFLVVKEKKRVYEIKLRAIQKRYDEVCKTARVNIFQRVNKPNSLYTTFLNPSYFQILKYMDYVEVRRSSTKNTKITKKAGSEKKDYLSYGDVIKEPITEITSRYHFIQSRIKNKADEKLGIFKDKFSLVDTQTGKTLASYVTFWSRDLKKICPTAPYKWEMSTIKYVFNISDDVEPEFIIHTSDSTSEK